MHPCGVREGGLRDRLITEREHIEGQLKKAWSAKSTSGMIQLHINSQFHDRVWYAYVLYLLRCILVHIMCIVLFLNFSRIN